LNQATNSVVRFKRERHSNYRTSGSQVGIFAAPALSHKNAA